MKKYTVTGVVQQFPQAGGWVYLPITQTYADFGGKPKWGLVPATITLGNTTWRRSLLPFGDGTLFIALNKSVRAAEHVQVGDTITVSFMV
jgi:hypothetical protein